MTKKTPKVCRDRRLLATMTKEPFQPVRLYYSIPSCSFVAERLRSLKCVIEMPNERCWQWLYHAEAASLPISGDTAPCRPRGDRSCSDASSFRRAAA